MGETYYEVLGVDPEATRDEIQAAYRERVLETHPDHNDDPDAAEQFKRVSTARSVLTDGDERARYDRLGHDAYVSLGERTAGGSSDASSTTSDSGDSNADSSGSAGATTSGAGASSGRRRGNSTGPGSGRRTGRTWTGTSSDTGSDDDRGRSHHARQRKRRRRKRAQRRAAGQWPFGTETSAGGEGTEGGGATAGAAGTAGTATAGPTGGDPEASGSNVRYTVHGWDEEIDLEWDGQSLDQSTAVTVSCIWLLYPILVVSSLTAAFPALVNVVVAGCTIAIAGYLLTRPRIAIPLFGFWSLMFPLVMVRAGVSPVSVIGLIALGFVWVPFGYAVGFWWALRP